LGATPARDHVDLVVTWRDGAYEVWASRGMIRFKRYVDDDRRTSFRCHRAGRRQSDRRIRIRSQFPPSNEEMQASGTSGNSSSDPNRAFLEPHAVTHPFAYERIAQLFDSRRAPDFMVSPKAYTYGIQPGSMERWTWCKSQRAPLIFFGTGV